MFVSVLLGRDGDFAMTTTVDDDDDGDEEVGLIEDIYAADRPW
jgi:hypothetical protein